MLPLNTLLLAASPLPLNAVELPADSSAAPGMMRLNKPVEAPMEAFWAFDLSTLLLDLVEAVVLSVILTVIVSPT